jgi:hypothetical protein
MSKARFLAYIAHGGKALRRLSVTLLALTALVAGTGVFAYQGEIATAAQTLLLPEPYSQAAFQDWQAEDERHRAAFAEFTRYLGEQGVGDVVPAWQLTRTDFTGRAACERPQFLIPPRQNWNRIVPVLALVRDEIVPLVGPVEVMSSYRTTDFNTCVGGAAASRHLGFRALDLIAREQLSNRELFGILCRLHRQKGARYAMGLGAYFDPEREGQNRYGRFHIDVSGHRSWGYSQHGDSSACRVI